VGLLNKQIAHHLGIGESSVCANINRAIKLLDLPEGRNKRVMLTRWALRNDNAQITAHYDRCDAAMLGPIQP
jgi:DNA-binding NarL/FixJ family response regulator